MKTTVVHLTRVAECPATSAPVGVRGNTWTKPGILSRREKLPAITHLCSYASSHINGSTVRLSVQRDMESGGAIRDSRRQDAP
jgi:hypothetical protein